MKENLGHSMKIKQLAALERKVLRRMFGVIKLMKLGNNDIIKNY